VVILEVVVDEVAAEEEVVVPGAVVVVVLEAVVVPMSAPSSSLSRSRRGMATPAAITITAAAAIPSHRPRRLFLGGMGGAP
jgi:hypothetical protein